jgi:hypothetical protein
LRAGESEERWYGEGRQGEGRQREGRQRLRADRECRDERRKQRAESREQRAHLVQDADAHCSVRVHVRVLERREQRAESRD